MKSRILSELERIETDCSVRILVAVESGSRAWGFESPDSDFDVRFIYIAPPEDYITVEPVRDVLEFPINDELDISGWDIRKALYLLRKGNPPLMEWLHSPIVYREQSVFANKMREFIREYFKPKACLYHYQSMAQRNYNQYIVNDEVKLKKYLYVLRPVFACKWLLRHGAMPPMQFHTVFQDANLETNLRTAIDELLARKMAASELGTGPRIPVIDAFIESTFAEVQAFIANQLEDPALPIAMLNRFFREMLTANYNCGFFSAG